MERRITIYSINGNNKEEEERHRIKMMLEERSIPFEEVNLSEDPEKREDVVKASGGKQSFPHLFVDDEYIGDTAAHAIRRWEEDDTPHPHPTSAAAAVNADEGSSEGAAAFVRKEEAESAVRSPPPSMGESKCGNDESSGSGGSGSGDMIVVPNGRRISVLEMSLRLMACMPRNNLSFGLRTHKNCFFGSDGVDNLLYEFRDDGIHSRADALAFARLLHSRKIIRSVVGKGDDDRAAAHCYEDTTMLFYRLQPLHKPRILNSFRVWNIQQQQQQQQQNNPIAIVARLRQLLKSVERSIVKGTDSMNAEKQAQFAVFEEQSCELQSVDMSLMDDQMKTAFAINLYNLIIKHAFIKIGIQKRNSALIKRASFFSAVRYNIGGHILSFSDIENGILRANAPPPYMITEPFPKGSDLSKLALKTMDPRIHFALNSGSKSSPPLREYTYDNLQDELALMTQQYCAEDTNVFLDEDKNILRLPMIIRWYKSDFADSNSALVKVVLTYLQGEKREKLQRMIDNSKKTKRSSSKIRVRYFSYDWTLEDVSSSTTTTTTSGGDCNKSSNNKHLKSSSSRIRHELKKRMMKHRKRHQP